MCRSDAPVSAHSPDDYRKLGASRIDFGNILTGLGSSSNHPSVYLSRLITLSLKTNQRLGVILSRYDRSPSEIQAMIGVLGAKSPVKKAYTLESEAENKLLILVCDLQHLPTVDHQLRFESQCIGTYVSDLTDYDLKQIQTYPLCSPSHHGLSLSLTGPKSPKPFPELSYITDGWGRLDNAEKTKL